MANLIPTRILRTIEPVVRPVPGNLLEGQPAANLEESEPGLYFRSTSGDLIKIGPIAVGVDSPNHVDNGGDGTNAKGEAWLDKSAPEGPTLKIHDGTSFVNCFPVSYARSLISETAPNKANYLEGTNWWNPSTGLTYILYGTGSEAAWVQMASHPVR
jgi:hypothetical protein